MIPFDLLLFVPSAILGLIAARLAWWAADAILAALRGILAAADYLDLTKVARSVGASR